MHGTATTRITRTAQAVPPGAARLSPISEQPKPAAASSASPTPVPILRPRPSGCGSTTRRHADDRERDAGELQRRGALAAGVPYANGTTRPSRDRADDAHRADREAAVEARSPTTPASAAEHRPPTCAHVGVPWCVNASDDPDAEQSRDLLTVATTNTGSLRAPQPGAEIGEAPGEARARARAGPPSRRDGARRGDASSWFAWNSTAASAVRAARTS